MVAGLPGGAGVGLVTPSSSTISARPAATELVSVHTSVVGEVGPQPATCTPASVRTPLTLVSAFELGGSVIVIWLWAVGVSAPPAEVVKWITKSVRAPAAVDGDGVSTTGVDTLVASITG